MVFSSSWNKRTSKGLYFQLIFYECRGIPGPEDVGLISKCQVEGGSKGETVGRQTMELRVQRGLWEEEGEEGGGAGRPSLGHHSVAGTMLGTGNGGEDLVWWGKWTGQQTFAIWSDRCQEQGHRTRGRWPCGHNDLSHKPSK